jgi:hypothetical protein
LPGARAPNCYYFYSFFASIQRAEADLCLNQLETGGDLAAVLPSMMLAEQYFSWLMAMARSTAARECLCRSP